MPPKTPLMAPKIYKTQILKPNNTRVDVGGPTGDWEDEAVAAVFTVVLTQIDEDNNVVTAIGASQHVYDKTEPEWWVTVKVVGEGQLGLGDALVAAYATYVDDDGGSDWYGWTLPTRLVRAAN
jgi:hypothetical protein